MPARFSGVAMKPAGAFLLLAISSASAVTADKALFGPEHNFRLQYSKDGFGVRSHGVLEVVNGHSKFYPLPQSSFKTYAKLRPDEVKLNRVTAKYYDRQEVIGPHQVDGSKLWFGNQFYDGESMRGVGAFGYFDTESREYQLFSPPEVAPCKVSAILVEQETVWLALDHFGEDISTMPCRLVSWNRETHEVHAYKIEFVVTSIAREGDSLHLATHGGYAVLRDDVLQRFAIRKAANGKIIAAPIHKFPPPPSNN